MMKMRKFKHKQTKNTADELGDTFYTVKKDKTIICFIPDNMVENTQDWIEIKEPVFTTADGVEMYEGDAYYTNIGYNYVAKYVTEKKLKDSYLKNAHERFSIQGLAQEYLDYNAPKYSLNDIKEAIKSGTETKFTVIEILKNLKK